MNSKIGPLYLVASEKGLTGVYWSQQVIPLAQSLKLSLPQVRILKNTTKQLEEYLLGERKKFELPLELNGTHFQRQVWGELLKIPYGKTFSYSDIARKIKNPKAVRAVGSANAKNPICVIVPCHRVIPIDNKIGGYSGPVGIKEYLLNLENYNLKIPKASQ